MRVNFSVALKDHKNEVIKERTRETETSPIVETELTLKDAAISALYGRYADEDKLPGAKKYERFKLAQKIENSAAGDVDLKAEDVTLIKELIGKNYGPLVVGPAYDAIEGEGESVAQQG